MDATQLTEFLAKNGADMLMVAVTVVIVFAGYYVCPGPRDRNGDRILRVFPPWDSVLFIAPFFIGMALSVALDLDKAQPLASKIRDGLATGAYAMVIERGIFMTLAKRLRDAQVAVPLPPGQAPGSPLGVSPAPPQEGKP